LATKIYVEELGVNRLEHLLIVFDQFSKARRATLLHGRTLVVEPFLYNIQVTKQHVFNILIRRRQGIHLAFEFCETPNRTQSHDLITMLGPFEQDP
jgi:hypothetical protein